MLNGKSRLIKLRASAFHTKEKDVAVIYAHEEENGKENNVYEASRIWNVRYFKMKCLI